MRAYVMLTCGISYKLNEIVFDVLTVPRIKCVRVTAHSLLPVIEQFNYIFIEITSAATRVNIELFVPRGKITM